MILMVAGAEQLGGLAIEQKAARCIEGDGADAKARLDTVHRSAIDQQFGHQQIEVRRFDRPEPRRGNAQCRFACRVPMGSDPGGFGTMVGHDRTVGRKDAVAHRDRRRSIARDHDVGGDLHRRAVRAVRADLAADEDAPLRHVHRPGAHQPDIAVEPRALVEPALAERGIDAQRELVRPVCVVEKIGDIDREGRVAAGVLRDFVAVDEHARVAEDAIEFEADAARAIGGGGSAA